MLNARRIFKGIVFASLGLLFLTATARAQDIVKVAPKNVKVLFENDKVRVLEFRSKVGEKIPMHSHPACLVYTFNAGKTKFTTPDGKTVERETKAGQVTWNEPETHASENMGPGEAHALLIEMKGTAEHAEHPKPPAKQPAKKQ